MKNIYLAIMLCTLCFCVACKPQVIVEPTDHHPTAKHQSTILDNGDELITLRSGVPLIKKGNDYILQEDIRLSPEQVAILDNPATSKGAYDHDFFSKKWDNHEIPYFLEPNFESVPEFNYAIKHIEERTNLRFIPRTNQKDYICFNTSGSNDSELGRVGGRQVINIFPQQPSYIIVHEIGHALGLVHEHCRPDRGDYINVDYDNIRPAKRHNFWIVRLGTCLTPTPDFESVMMYDGLITSSSFVYDTSRPVITKISDGTPTRQGFMLSSGDISSLAQMYRISKYAISGSQNVQPSSQESYSIHSYVDMSNVRNITWSVEPSTATIVSGQGTRSINVAFPANTGNFNVKATIQFQSGYNRVLAPRPIVSAVRPIIGEIYCSKYGQGDGEYTLFASMVNDLTVSTSWMCDCDAVFYGVPYPDDASFAAHPNLYTAVDFYRSGPHNITLYATNSYGTSMHTQTFYHNDVKSGSFPMTISPNPSIQGQAVELEIDPQAVNTRSTENYTVQVRNANNELVHTNVGSTNKLTLDVSTLARGNYSISTYKHNAKRTYISHLIVK